MRAAGGRKQTARQRHEPRRRPATAPPRCPKTPLTPARAAPGPARVPRASPRQVPAGAHVRCRPAVEVLTASEVALRWWRPHVHADDGFHGDLRARNGHCGRRQENRLQRPEVTFLRNQSAAAGVTLATTRTNSVKLIYYENDVEGQSSISLIF